MSLIIKVSKNGSSQEYLFNKLGPIVIGSDPSSDLWLDDESIDQRLLEVKISGGNIFIRELGAKGEIFLDSVILPFKEETLYEEGACVSVKDSLYLIHIHKVAAESLEPPPFFEREFKERLDKMNLKIHEKETELKALEGSQKIQKNEINDLEDKWHRSASEMNRVEVLVSGLKAHKDNLSNEIRRNSGRLEEEEDKVKELQDFVKRLEGEERTLKDAIVAQTLVLSNLREERAAKSREMDSQRIILSNLQLESSQMEQKLREYSDDKIHQQDEMKRESDKIQKILSQSESAKRECIRIQEHMAILMKEKAILDHDVQDLQSEVTRLEGLRKEAQNKLGDLKSQIEHESVAAQKIHEDIQRCQEEESTLKAINGELRTELNKAEAKLSLKKNHLNQIDFQSQDATRKLSTVNFELERATLRLNELQSEEKNHDLKMMSLREELQNFSKKANDDKKTIAKSIEDEKYKIGLELASLKNEIDDGRKYQSKLETDKSILQLQIEELHAKFRSMGKDKVQLEGIVNELHSQKSHIEAQILTLKNETHNHEHNRNKVQRELAQINLKLADCESSILEMQEDARREMDSYKREERAKILAEKEVSFAEVEAFRQKSLNDVEVQFRKKQDEVHQLKSIAQAEAEEIVTHARKAELAITQEASDRLKVATIEAQERENLSHQKVKEAHEFYSEKEKEAEALIHKSRMEAREYIKRNERELLEDLAKRKIKIKKFLSMKQEIGLQHLKSLSDSHVARMHKNEERGQQRIEELKRKELKKIARMREEEVTRHHEMKASLMKEFREEEAKAKKAIQQLRAVQESELANKKKSVLEHINDTKMRHQKNWEDEINKERIAFERTKRERVTNATQAVMNVLVAEKTALGDKEDLVKAKILSSLEMAINGQNAKAAGEMQQVLDINPDKRKKILPVLKKYALRFGVPAAVALILLADIGSFRSSIVNGSLELLKQKESASQLYVDQQKSEWKEKHTYNPEPTEGYKDTYVDNVIYTANFETVMDDEAFQNDWILKVHDFMVKDMELSEDVAINFISSEGTLIKELAAARKDLHPQFLDTGLKKMHELEKTHLGWLEEKIPEVSQRAKFTDFRRGVFDTFYKEKFGNSRGLAGKK